MKSRITLGPSEFSEGDEVIEIEACIAREDEPDSELENQVLYMTPLEMEGLYRRLKTYYERSIWTSGSVER